MKKKIPVFRSDREAADFVERADLWGGEFVRFEMKPKDKTGNLRLPSELLDSVRKHAKRAGIPYQRFIRMVLERAVM